MSDLIDRQAAIAKFEPWLKVEGYSEGELNMPTKVEFHVFRKTAHPRKGGAQGWERAVVADTLNVFDNCEQRTPILICETHKRRTK